MVSTRDVLTIYVASFSIWLVLWLVKILETRTMYEN